MVIKYNQIFLINLLKENGSMFVLYIIQFGYLYLFIYISVKIMLFWMFLKVHD